MRQDNTSFPKLFTTRLEEVFPNLKENNRCIKVDGEYLNHFRFSHDIIFFSHNPHELQKIMKELNKSIVVKDEFNIIIGNNNIVKINHYIYLGQHTFICYCYYM